MLDCLIAAKAANDPTSMILGGFVCLAATAAIVGVAIYQIHKRNELMSRMSSAERSSFLAAEAAAKEDAYQAATWGELRPEVACSHCKIVGGVRMKAVKKKRGISGGKASAAVLTGGLSIVATGLSRKDAMTQCHCMNCDCTWHFE